MISFLQSQVWADFQKSINRKIWRLDEVLVIKHNLLFNKSYFYSPRCGGNFLLESFLGEIRKIAKKENSIFLKIEPSFARATDGKPLYLEEFGFIKGHNIQPSKTLILNIEKSEQELLEQMHYKTRYNIQLARKRGVEIRNPKSEIRNFEEFWKLMKQTSKRDKFHPHPKEYYKKLLQIPGVELFVAEYQGRVIAANIVLFYERAVIYLHGASDYKHRNLMAPFLLQWSQILEAKKRGCIEYDFWGIDEKKWPGVTRFKKGFGGHEISYPGAYDLVFQPMWYKIYKIARKIL